MHIAYKVHGYNTKTKSDLIRSAPDKEMAREMVNLFATAPELTNLSFSWEGSEPVVQECGTIPDSILDSYLDIFAAQP